MLISTKTKGGLIMITEYLPIITANRVKQIAKEKDISISKLSEICELNQNTIKQSGKGTDGMKAKTLFAIAETLNCSVDYLLGRTDIKEVCSAPLCYNNQNNMKIGGNNEININNNLSDTEKELHDILTKLSYRKVNELMSLVYKFLDENSD